MSNYTGGIRWAVGEGFFYNLNVQLERTDASGAGLSRRLWPVRSKLSLELFDMHRQLGKPSAMQKATDVRPYLCPPGVKNDDHHKRTEL